jgi:two-component system chemotaxis response regulator CheB
MGGKKIQKIVSVVIGTSTGGIYALHEILPKFRKTNTYAISIVMHIISPDVVKNLAKRLDGLCALDVKIAKQGLPIEPDNVYFMPCDYHAEIKREGGGAVINLHKGPKVNFVRPSVDVLMKSIADVFKEDSIGVLLTGMGMDGSNGLKEIKNSGGSTIVQNVKESAVAQMPQSAIFLDCVDSVLSLELIPTKTQLLIDKKTLKWGT